MSQPDAIYLLIGSGTTLAGVLVTSATQLWRERSLHRRAVNQQKADRLRAEYKALLANAYAWRRSTAATIRALQYAASESRPSRELESAEEERARTEVELESSIQMIEIEPEVPTTILASYFTAFKSVGPANQAIRAAMDQYKELMQNWDSLLDAQQTAVVARGLEKSTDLNDLVPLVQEWLTLPLGEGTRAKIAAWLANETDRNRTQYEEIVKEMQQLPAESKASLESAVNEIDRWIAVLLQAIRSHLASLEK